MSAGPTQLRAGGEEGWGLNQAELCDRHRGTSARMCALAELQKARARAAAWLPRVELRRRLVSRWTGQCAREDRAARTTICTAMQHPEIATASATASKNERFVRKACPARPAFPTRRFAGEGRPVVAKLPWRARSSCTCKRSAGVSPVTPAAHARRCGRVPSRARMRDRGEGGRGHGERRPRKRAMPTSAAAPERSS
jgi:hypothetical protein